MESQQKLKIEDAITLRGLSLALPFVSLSMIAFEAKLWKW
jgi:hypothetical protein